MKNLREYTLSLLSIYNIEKEDSIRLSDDLDYYFLECNDKDMRLYLVNLSKTEFFIIYKKDSDWTSDKLNLIISNSLKKSHHMLIRVNSYHGTMVKGFWDDIESSTDYFKNTRKFRKEFKKLESETIVEEKTTLTIDEILNKINDKGIESLSEQEKQFLNKDKT